MKLRLLVADRADQLDSSLLGGILPEQVEVVAVARDGEQLRKLIREVEPDIVVTEIDLPLTDALTVIRESREEFPDCRFIAMSREKTFDCVLGAWKSGADDFLPKPVSREALEAALLAQVEHLEQGRKELAGAGNETVRTFFLHNVNELVRNTTLQQINQNYLTSFRKGLFRFLFVKIDHPNRVDFYLESVPSLTQKIQDIMQYRFAANCYDVLYESKMDGLLVLMNYAPELDDWVRKTILDALPQIKSATNYYYGLIVTVGVGEAYEEYYLAPRSRDQAFEIIWTRMLQRTGRVLFWQKASHEIEDSYRRKLEELSERIKKACDVLDVKELKGCIQELFTLPESVLGQAETRSYMRHIVQVFFEVAENLVPGDRVVTDDLREQTNNMLKMSNTLEQYEHTLEQQISMVMEQLVEKVERSNIRPIRKAMAYVGEHYAEKINLKDVADSVNLSPVYFSYVFKKETGQTFTDYVTNFRVNVAKELLKTTDKPINEIAQETGFSDPYYFSKLFKKNVGANPKDYRRLYA